MPPPTTAVLKHNSVRSPNATANSVQAPSVTASVATSMKTDASTKAKALWTRQQEIDAKKMEEQMPSVLRVFYRLVIKPCFVPGEPFDEYIRKAAVITVSLMASIGPLMVIWPAIVASTDDAGWTVQRIGIMIQGGYVATHFTTFSYFFIRLTKTCPMWLSDLHFFMCATILLETTVLSEPMDSRIILLCTLLLTSMSSSTRFVPIALWHGLIYIFHYMRQHFDDDIPELKFSFDEPERTVSEKVLNLLLAITPPGSAALGMYFVITSYIKRSKEAQMTNIMTITIADQLQRYDTKAVNTTLKEHEGTVNDKLLEAFRAINGNLESYRPHIPRYLIDAAVERAEEAEARAIEAERRVEQGTLAESEALSEGSLMSTSHCTGSMYRHDAASTSTDDMAHSRHKSPIISSGGSFSTAVSPHDPSATKGFDGSVTTLYLRLFDLSDEATLSKPLAQRLSMSELNAAIEEINKLASTTAASVHHIESGIMTITWNATKRTANHELRACNFALRALEILRGHEAFKDTAAASIMRCQATTHFVGTSQMHFILAHDDVERHRELLRMAVEHKTITVSPGVVHGADTQYAFVGFNVCRRGRLVYELVKNKSSSQAQDEEWMYALHTQDHDKDPFTRITTAAAKMLLPDGGESMKVPGRGESDALRMASAKELLSDIPEELSQRSTVQELLSRH